ncbi:MAG: hypothetical protein ACMUJM_24450 [bacterium]
MIWSSIPKGKLALCIIGAGFPIAVLKNSPPSTKNILQKAAKETPDSYPIITEIIRNNPHLTLNKLWSDIYKFSVSVSYAYPTIYKHYMSTESNMKKFFKELSRDGRSFIDILWLGLGLELKKAVSQFYNMTNKDNFEYSKINNFRNIFEKFDKRFWVSLNYDLVLEEAIMKILSLDLFNDTTEQVRYLNEEFLNNLIFTPKCTSKDVIIKPHGSINLSFETDWSISSHVLRFIDQKDYLKAFDHNKIGYEIRSGSRHESRPSIIGYVPDDFKDELNSKSYFSDIAHDFCKLQMSSMIFPMNQADCIFIFGYSMPKEDAWIWKRIKDIQNKTKQIIICSHADSNRIEEEINLFGFDKTNVLNDGNI